MGKSLGKSFEDKFLSNFSKIPDTCVTRLYDTTNGFYGVRNPCDFICYKYPNIFYIECKTVGGDRFPFSNLSQYDKLLEYMGFTGTRVGVVIWFYEKDRVIYLPISSIKELKLQGKKSFSIARLSDVFYLDIPSRKKRTYMDSDYRVLFNLVDGQ